jgi:hypothetical protein
VNARQIVFLDVDGVLVTRRSLESRTKHGMVVNSDCVSALNSITTETGAMIVLSSSWRFCGESEMRAILSMWGVEGKLIGITPDLTRVPMVPGGLYVGVARRDEIKAWILAHGEEGDSYVIIDDDADANLENRLIRTVFELGLTDSGARRAVEMLADIRACREVAL